MNIRYRITKYNPVNRDEQGRYPKGEWTAVSDIGNPRCNPPLTLSEYLLTEAAYVDAIMEISRHFNLLFFTVQHAEKQFPLFSEARSLKRLGIPLSKEEKLLFRDFKTGMLLSLDQIPYAARLILREMCWAELVSGSNMKIEFGYDYYMYITCPVLHDDILARLTSNGLFVEY